LEGLVAIVVGKLEWLNLEGLVAIVVGKLEWLGAIVVVGRRGLVSIVVIVVGSPIIIIIIIAIVVIALSFVVVPVGVPVAVPEVGSSILVVYGHGGCLFACADVKDQACRSFGIEDGPSVLLRTSWLVALLGSDIGVEEALEDFGADCCSWRLLVACRACFAWTKVVGVFLASVEDGLGPCSNGASRRLV
jgi:hypothetical protein